MELRVVLIKIPSIELSYDNLYIDKYGFLYYYIDNEGANIWHATLLNRK